MDDIQEVPSFPEHDEVVVIPEDLPEFTGDELPAGPPPKSEPKPDLKKYPLPEGLL